MNTDLTLTTISAMQEKSVLQILNEWSDLGWIRRLDSALVVFINDLESKSHSGNLKAGTDSNPIDCASDRSVLSVSIAMLAFFEGHGHTCLNLRQLVSDPNALLGWTEDRLDALKALWKKLPARLEDWLAQLKVCSVVDSKTVPVRVRHSYPASPLVLAGTDQEPILYLRRYWNYEQQVSQSILDRLRIPHVVDETRAAKILDRLFQTAANPASLFDWQKFACALALRSSLTVITGGPGTGKTYTAARLLALLFAVDPEPQRLRIALAAPTGKAAARLRQSIDKALEDLSRQVSGEVELTELARRIGAARTLHSLLGASSDSRQFRYNAANQLDVDVLIVDEASMVHLEMMSALLQALPATARLILLGDKDQLDSVEAGAVLGDLTRHAAKGMYDTETARFATAVTGQEIPQDFRTSELTLSSLAQQTIMLRESRRFGAVIGQLALAVNEGDAVKVDLHLQGDSSRSVQAFGDATPSDITALATNGRVAAVYSYANYLNAIKQRSKAGYQRSEDHDAWIKTVLNEFDQFRILCAVNQGEWGTDAVNQSVLIALEKAGLINTGKTGKEWFPGRPIMVTRNDPDLGVFNGDVGVVLPSLSKVVAEDDSASQFKGNETLRAYFLDGDQLRSVSVSRLAHVETAFAMTVHKSQGSEYRHVALILPAGRNEHLSRELIYTGITRARECLTIIEGQEGAFKRAVARPSSRTSGLANIL